MFRKYFIMNKFIIVWFVERVLEHANISLSYVFVVGQPYFILVFSKKFSQKGDIGC